ncbi:MAG TPA: ATP-dependent DNA ligase [Acidisarcina sp.]
MDNSPLGSGAVSARAAAAPTAPAPPCSSFRAFAELCEALAGTTRKLEKRSLIAAWLRTLSPTDAGRGALFLAGTPFPETDPRGLSVGGALLARAIAELSGADDAALHAAYLRHGDMGGAAFDVLLQRETRGLVTHGPDTRVPDHPASEDGGPRSTSTPDAPLTLGEVEQAFALIAAISRAAAKLHLVLELLRRATTLEAKYLIKLMLGDMRTGVKQSLVEEGIAAAYGVDAAQVRRASMLNGSLPEVVGMAASGRLDEAQMRLFHPLGFMLASPVDSVDEALARFAQEIVVEQSGASDAVADPASSGEKMAEPQSTAVPALEVVIHEAQMEDKYDGIRAQLHAGDPAQPGRVALFSRSREDMTMSFPEVAEAFAQLDRPIILDGEILGWDPATSRALPFSSLQQRVGRKRVTAEMRQSTPVVFMAFDVLYLDGELLLELPLSRRRLVLESLVSGEATRLIDHGATEAVRTPATSARAARRTSQQALFKEPESNLAGQAPGLASRFSRLVLAPAVRLDSAEQLEQAYADARARGNEGVMLKALHSIYQPGRRGLAWLKLKRELATLDVVVTAVEYGHGRRANVLSDYTFAVRDGDVLKNVGKAYSGLTDAEINEYTAFFLDHTLEDYGRVRSVEPLLVLEVAFNNIMRSDRHASGFALRFPRILRIRTDKLPVDVDTIARVEEIYNSQPDRPVE